MDYKFKDWTYLGTEVPVYDQNGDRFLAHTYKRGSNESPCYKIIDDTSIQDKIKEGGFDLARRFIKQELNTKW